MRPPFFPSPIFRLSGRPRPELAAGVPRPRGTRRPHHNGTVNDVRGLIEQTTLTYHQIARRTGVSPASISRWMQAGEWKRPLFAPQSMSNMPTPRASAYLKRRLLAKRLLALADRYVRELEEAPGVDLDKLGEALELGLSPLDIKHHPAYRVPIGGARAASRTRRRRRSRTRSASSRAPYSAGSRRSKRRS